MYDKTKVDIEDLEREGYNIFLDQKYKGDVYLYDSERDSFMMALESPWLFHEYGKRSGTQ